MKNFKKITAVLLCFALLFSTAFASDYTYGDGDGYTETDILAKFAKLIDGSAAVSSGSDSGEELYDTEGYAYICADAFVIGGGYILYPTKVKLLNGDTAASVLLRAMEQSGMTCEYNGTDQEDFYLKRINGANFTPYIEAGLEEWLSGIVSYFEPDEWSVGTLGEFDITNMSGWMFFLNGEMPSVGMSGCAVNSGDVISVRFSLAYGMDLGGDVFGDCEAPYVENVNRDEVTKAITEGRLSYSKYENILNKASTTQEEIDELLQNI